MPRFTRYTDRASGWLGYLEPASRRWVLFFTARGWPVFFGRRTASGACV